MKKAGKMWLIAVCILLLCCACGASDPEDTGSADPGASSANSSQSSLATPYVGILLKSVDTSYFSLIKAGAEAEADALGVQVMVVSPDEEVNTADQADMLLTMAGMAVDVIVVAPSSTEYLEDGLQRAVQNGKIIMAVDTNLDSDTCSCYIGTDNYNAAYEQGEYAAQLVGENANAVILRGQADDKVHTLREYGLTDALREGGVTVLDTAVCNSSETQAEQVMSELLDTYSDLDIICVTSDSMAVGAQRAIADAERDIHIVSFDGMMEASELTRVGEIDATFAQSPYEMGRLCIQNAVKLYRGEKVERTIYTDTERITQGNARAHMDEIKRQLSGKKTK